jgi:beta-carotene/zeaxanthin 4-ketolase
MSHTQPARELVIGLSLAAAIFSGWLVLHVTGIFLVELRSVHILTAISIVAVQVWLSVGIFIIAHDAMHGSLAPSHPRLNRMIGRAMLFLFAGLSYDRLEPSHHAHHRYAGTANDPDFDPDHASAFLPWFMTFIRKHVGWREIAGHALVVGFYTLALGASLSNVVVFWSVPAALATVQLFYFGTYRPHRHGDELFADRHRSRSDTFPTWLSILTCFNFGRHHEHHDAPHVPWWRLMPHPLAGQAKR